MSGNIRVVGGGRLTMVDGGTVFSGNARVGDANDVVSEVTVGSDAAWIVDGELDVRAQGVLRLQGQADGVLVMDNPTGFAFEPGKVTVGPGGRLGGTGTIVATELVVRGSGDVLGFGGTVSPGSSPGTLNIDGGFRIEERGVLHIELAGTDAGEFDVVRVSGGASLGGHLLLDFIDDFAPRQGDAFEFLDVTGILAGSFASVELRNLAPGFQFDLQRDGGGLTLLALNDGAYVPEPGAAGTLLLCAGAELIRRRRRSARSAAAPRYVATQRESA
jgi:hypothetical protein